jgi:hypothetical protein
MGAADRHIEHGLSALSNWSIHALRDLRGDGAFSGIQRLRPDPIIDAGKLRGAHCRVNLRRYC